MGPLLFLAPKLEKEGEMVAESVWSRGEWWPRLAPPTFPFPVQEIEAAAEVKGGARGGAMLPVNLLLEAAASASLVGDSWPSWFRFSRMHCKLAAGAALLRRGAVRLE